MTEPIYDYEAPAEPVAEPTEVVTEDVTETVAESIADAGPTFVAPDSRGKGDADMQPGWPYTKLTAGEVVTGLVVDAVIASHEDKAEDTSDNKGDAAQADQADAGTDNSGGEDAGTEEAAGQPDATVDQEMVTGIVLSTVNIALARRAGILLVADDSEFDFEDAAQEAEAANEARLNAELEAVNEVDAAAKVSADTETKVDPGATADDQPQAVPEQLIDPGDQGDVSADVLPDGGATGVVETVEEPAVDVADVVDVPATSAAVQQIEAVDLAPDVTGPGATDGVDIADGHNSPVENSGNFDGAVDTVDGEGGETVNIHAQTVDAIPVPAPVPPVVVATAAVEMGAGDSPEAAVEAVGYGGDAGSAEQVQDAASEGEVASPVVASSEKGSTVDGTHSDKTVGADAFSEALAQVETGGSVGKGSDDSSPTTNQGGQSTAYNPTSARVAEAGTLAGALIKSVASGIGNAAKAATMEGVVVRRKKGSLFDYTVTVNGKPAQSVRGIIPVAAVIRARLQAARAQNS